MKKTCECEFTIQISDDDIMEQFDEIIKRTPSRLEDLFEAYDDQVRKYAKDHLEMIDLEDANEHCSHTNT